MSGAERLPLVGMVEKHGRADNSPVIGTLRIVKASPKARTQSDGLIQKDQRLPFRSQY